MDQINIRKINDFRRQRVQDLRKGARKIRQVAKGEDDDDDGGAHVPPDPSKSRSSYRMYNFYTWYNNVRQKPVHPIAFPHSYSCRQINGDQEKRTVTILPKSSFAYKKGHERTQFYKDSKFYKELQHPNLIPLYETYRDETHYFLVTANLDLPNLYQAIPLLVDHPDALGEPHIAKIVRTILTAFMYCHDQGVVHGNVSYEHILVDPTTIQETGGLDQLKLVGCAFCEKLRPNRLAPTHYYDDPKACCVTGMKIGKTKAEKKLEKKLEQKRQRALKKQAKQQAKQDAILLAQQQAQEQEELERLEQEKLEQQLSGEKEGEEIMVDDLPTDDEDEMEPTDLHRPDLDEHDRWNESYHSEEEYDPDALDDMELAVHQAMELVEDRIEQSRDKILNFGQEDGDHPDDSLTSFNPVESYSTIDTFDNKDRVDPAMLQKAQQSPMKRSDRFAAPETRWGDMSVFEPPADLWSVGVLTYQLLARQHPFMDHKSPSERITPLHYRDQTWKDHHFQTAPHLQHLSAGAKQFLQDLLQFDPARRPTAHETYDHDWLCTALAGPVDPELAKKHLEIFSNLVHFKGDAPLQRAARSYIANNMLPEEEKELLDSAYELMDRDKEGSISKDELRSALVKYPEALKGFRLPKAKKNQLKALAKQSLKAAKIGQVENPPRLSRFDRVVDDVFGRVDLDGEGVIEYEEYLAAAASDTFIQVTENLEHAFRHFDLDADGYLDLEDLRHMFGKDKKKAKSVLHRWDRKKIGKLSFQEFRAAMFE